MFIIEEDEEDEETGCEPVCSAEEFAAYEGNYDYDDEDDEDD